MWGRVLRHNVNQAGRPGRVIGTCCMTTAPVVCSQLNSGPVYDVCWVLSRRPVTWHCLS